ncbi:MAG: RnfABCDGE type electron transport complex subunit D [Planctomycetota bacterium]|jgi:electron transport complex protein RnfD|nr:RnfABCDGE type electron transport complex subunit D [Planctomycetota bacterium]
MTMSAEEKKLLFNVNNSPHIRDGDTTPRIMGLVCLALAPALAWALLAFGWYAIVPVFFSVAACVLTEWAIVAWRGLPRSIDDGSAVVTGLLLAAVCPPNLPWWAAVVGGVFAIGIGKQAFGGLGHNIWNPALLGRAFMQASMPDRMMSGEWPHLGLAGKWWNNIFHYLGGSFSEIAGRINSNPDAVTRASMAGAVDAASGVDVMTGATLLDAMHVPAAGGIVDAAGNVAYHAPKALSPGWSSILYGWLGVEGGSLGEVSAVLLVIGGLYLLRKKVIPWDIPFFFILVAAVLGWAFPQPYKIGDAYAYTPWFQGPWLAHLGAGGLMLGAFFMATDMVTGPLTRKGRIIFACGCGVMTMVIRLFGGYPEGVCYAILLMNTCVPLIDSLTRPRVFGTGVKKQ